LYLTTFSILRFYIVLLAKYPRGLRRRCVPHNSAEWSRPHHYVYLLLRLHAHQ
jgi:hypothetical protein